MLASSDKDERAAFADFKKLASRSVALISPADGAVLNQSIDSAPRFEWKLCREAASYRLILIHIGLLGISDTTIEYSGQTSDSFLMNDTTWQDLPTGTWYWSVMAKNKASKWITPNYTMYRFEVK